MGEVKRVRRNAGSILLRQMRELRIELAGANEARLRLGRAVHRLERMPARGMEGGRALVKLDRLVDAGKPLVEAAKLAKGCTAIAMRRRIAGIERDSLIEVAQSVGEASGAHQHAAAVEERGRK